jgi:hypothetical protein
LIKIVVIKIEGCIATSRAMKSLVARIPVSFFLQWIYDETRREALMSGDGNNSNNVYMEVCAWTASRWHAYSPQVEFVI